MNFLNPSLREEELPLGLEAHAGEHVGDDRDQVVLQTNIFIKTMFNSLIVKMRRNKLLSEEDGILYIFHTTLIN